MSIDKATLQRWRELLEPYQFGGEYGDYNNNGVLEVMDEIDQLLKAHE